MDRTSDASTNGLAGQIEGSEGADIPDAWAAWEAKSPEQQLGEILEKWPVTSWGKEPALSVMGAFRRRPLQWFNVAAEWQERGTYLSFKVFEAAVDDWLKQLGATKPVPTRSTVDVPAYKEDEYPYSDAYNAACLVEAHGHEMRYCAPWKTWLTWTGTHWQRDISGELLRWQREIVHGLGGLLPDLKESEAKALLVHIKSSLNTSRLEAAVRQAQSWEGVSIGTAALDSDPWVLNCANGTLDLRTGNLRPHASEDMLTKCLPIAYNPTARYPQWIEFVEKAMGGDGELVDFLQRALGYSLTGSTREQCFFLLHGPTKTGKSTFMHIAKALLGPYGTQAETSTFLHKDRDTVRNDLADLAGMRLVAAIETDEGKRLAEALIKQLTGGTDTIKARFLFEEYFEYRPQFKVFFATNHLPKVSADDEAIWERVYPVPFKVQIPKEARDKELETKLLAELEGVLAWAVRGCLKWQRDGDLKVPEAVTAYAKDYRDEMDDVGRFLTDVCLLDEDHYKVSGSVLLKAYHQWCGQSVMTGKKFAKALEDKGYTATHERTGNFWQRIGLPAVTENSDQDKA